MAIALAITTPAAVDADDPIIAAIGKHRAALNAFERACKDPARDHDDDDGLPEMYAEIAAQAELFDLAPVTVAGAAALCEHLASPEFSGPHNLNCVLAAAFLSKDVDGEHALPRQLRAIAALLRQS
jgi:hypothetical protein